MTTALPPIDESLLEALPTLAEGERAEDRLLDLGWLSERDLGLQIALGAGRAFTGLREFTPDPKLFLYVPLALAEREKVVPLVLVGDTLKLASAYYAPDLDLVRQRFPKVDIDLVVAMRSEVEAALERATTATTPEDPAA